MYSIFKDRMYGFNKYHINCMHIIYIPMLPDFYPNQLEV